MTLHLRCADTSVVLDLPDDRFPVVRHWGPDLGDVSGDDLSDTALAAQTSLAPTPLGSPTTCRSCLWHTWAGTRAPP